MAMQYEPVDSSAINALGYDPQTQTLGVRFQSGTEYHYAGVTPEAFAALKGAKSIGQHFAHAVREKYKTTKQPQQRHR